jgi:hypothetical protein
MGTFAWSAGTKIGSGTNPADGEHTPRGRAVNTIALTVEPQFFLEGKTIEHPLENILKASGWAILTSIERQRMSVMNVKGQLAEYYLNKELETLAAAMRIQGFEWRTQSPDFSVMFDNRSFSMECKNVRKEIGKKIDPWWVEIQRTRDSKKGKSTRAYTVHDFDILAVCLFNRTGEWRYWFAAAGNLARRPSDDNLLAVHQNMPLEPDTIWHTGLCEAIDDVRKRAD